MMSKLKENWLKKQCWLKDKLDYEAESNSYEDKLLNLTDKVSFATSRWGRKWSFKIQHFI